MMNMFVSLRAMLSFYFSLYNMTEYLINLMFWFNDLKVREAFAIAAAEPKIQSRQAMLDIVSQPLAPLPPPLLAAESEPKEEGKQKGKKKKKTKKMKKAVMRKHMTSVFGEALKADERVVYIGEDVEHGGYYLVTEGLAKSYPHRVRDFPPDETTLVGAAIGFSQVGLVPVLEIPYAK